MQRNSRNLQRNSRNRNISIRSKRRNVDTPTETREKGRTTRKPTTNHPFINTQKDPSNMYAQTMFRKTPAEVPPTQAAYQQGRSTTELVFTFKVLAERPSCPRTIRSYYYY